MSSQFPTLARLMSTRIFLPFAWPWHTTAAQRRGLLGVIAAGLEERIPLVPLLDAWAEDERGIQQRRLWKLVGLMAEGTPLVDAVEQVPGVLRDEDVLALRFDAQSGTVATAVREILDKPASASLDRLSRLRSTNMYLWMVLILGFPIVVFIEMRIMPAFRAIFHEFALDLPGVTEAFLRLTGFFANNAWIFVLILLVGLLSLIFARPGRFVRQKVGRMFGTIRTQRTASLLRLIAIASNAGRPVAGALSTLARYHFDATLRNKLLFVRNEMEQGADMWQSMNAVDLISEPDARALSISERLGNRAWVLTQLADAKSRQSLRRLDHVSQLVLPVVVILFGLFVLFQALALLAPLVKLIQGLAV